MVMHFKSKVKATKYFRGCGMQILTKQELDDKAWAWLAEEAQDANVTEWLLIHDGLTVYMVILYKRTGMKGIFALQKTLFKYA